MLWGRSGSGKTTAAAWLAQQLARPLLVIDAAPLAHQPPDRLAETLQLAQREAQLRGAILLLRHMDALDAERLVLVLRHLQPGMILAAQRLPALHGQAQPPLTVHSAPPEHAARCELWRAALNGHAHLHAALPAELAARFQLTPGQIQRAAALAQQQAWLRGGPSAAPERGDLFESCRQQSNPNLARLAAKVVTPYGWDDLVLPDMQMGLLHAVESQVRHSHRVYEQWGFGRKLAPGRGLNVLFSGPPGTGKTMAAGHSGAIAGPRPLQDRPVRRGQQIHRRNRKEPEPHL